MTAQTDAAREGLLDRLFGLKRAEHTAAAWSFVYFFCVLSAYYILRPVREMLGTQSGPETLPYLFMASFAVMLLATPAFGWITSRYPRKVFLPWVYLFFVGNILLFWAVFSLLIDRDQNHVWLGRVFYVWLSVFNLYVVSVFWSFMADIYTREQGRRLFGLVSSGGSVGALLGGAATSSLVTNINFHNLFPIAAALLSFAMVCIWKLRRWTGHDANEQARTSIDSEQTLGGHPLAGATRAFGSNYFRAIAVASIIASLLGTAIYYFRADLVATTIADANLQTRFFSNINIATNLLTIVGQMFVVKFVVQRFGIGVALSILPVVSLFCFAWAAYDPSLLVIAWVDIIRRAAGFTFGKPSTDMLYSVVTPEEKYKTKNFIDTTVYRFGDVIGIWTSRVLLTIGMSAASLILMPFVVVWAIIALWLGREYRSKARSLKEEGIA